MRVRGERVDQGVGFGRVHGGFEVGQGVLLFGMIYEIRWLSFQHEWFPIYFDRFFTFFNYANFLVLRDDVRFRLY